MGEFTGHSLPTPLRFRRRFRLFDFFSAESTSLFGDSSAEVRGEAGFRPAPGGTIGLDGEDGGGERSCGFLRHARTPHSKAPTRFFFDFQSSSFSDLTRERVKDGRHFTVVRILLAG
jgi:hypothetical protein